MILTIGSEKGGCGKSTLATNFAFLLSASGKKTLLVDADPQKSSSDFVENREALGLETKWATVAMGGSSIRQQLLKLRDSFDIILIDCGGRDNVSQRSALTVSDVLLTPLAPKSFDLWSLEKFCAVISEVRSVNPSLKAFVALNRVDPKGSDASDAINIIGENAKEFICIKNTIGNRKAFSNAVALGLSVPELRPQDIKATAEIKALCNYIFNIKDVNDVKKSKVKK